jgi:hypothetical protein
LGISVAGCLLTAGGASLLRLDPRWCCRFGVCAELMAVVPGVVTAWAWAWAWAGAAVRRPFHPASTLSAPSSAAAAAALAATWRARRDPRAMSMAVGDVCVTIYTWTVSRSRATPPSGTRYGWRGRIGGFAEGTGRGLRCS